MAKDGRHPDPAIRRAQRVLRMVHELHKRGYQRVRIAPGMSASGAYWRCVVTHAANTRAEHGALLANYEEDVARYTSADGNHYFGWRDVQQDTARQLATKFLERFPDIAGKGQGQDWEYAGWYVHMLGLADQASLPIAYSDWDDETDPRYMPTTGRSDDELLMPPGGEATHRME